MTAYFAAVATILILVHVTFFLAVRFRRNDFADVLWGPGFAIAALGACFGRWWSGEDMALGVKTWAVLICVTLWAARLFYCIGLRNLRHSEEDVRYKRMRQGWKNEALQSYLVVFLLQGFFMFIIDLPAIHVVAKAPQDFDLFVLLGVVFWVIGFAFESIGDAQLKSFKANAANKGRLMTTGLWSWSRHPNYFGEVLQWWGVFVITANVPGGWFLVISPLTITFLILKVSGVPMMEELMKTRPGFAEYQRRTSVFFPLPPGTDSAKVVG